MESRSDEARTAWEDSTNIKRREGGWTDEERKTSHGAVSGDRLGDLRDAPAVRRPSTGHSTGVVEPATSSLCRKQRVMVAGGNAWLVSAYPYR